ncbi:MAG: hypothetical protein Ta2D_00810 [Rickettsiales bacterium]|nr:MAG: hypothetical protein Ta2D_00810 [Rickettsiales bacterium]
MRKNNNIISSEIVHFMDVNGGKDRQGNIQTHHVEIKYINDYQYKINKLLEQNATANATKENDSDFVGMDKRTMMKSVFDYYFNNGYGAVLNTKNIMFNNNVIFKNIELNYLCLSKTNIENSIQHSDIYKKNGKIYLKDNNQAIAFKFLDKIIENGIIIAKELNWKDDKKAYNTYLMGSKITIDNKEYIVESIIEELKDGTKQFYLHNTIEKEKFVDLLNNKTSQELLSGVPIPTEALKSNLETIKSNIADFVSNVKSFLKSK